ncbi:MAG: hypoxanthine phosphoribosyltransferase [Faecousia sp.]
MEKDIQEVLLTEEQIKTRIRELGEVLTAEYAGKDPVVVGVLKGVVVFYADMIREIKTPCQMDFMWISSYAGTDSTGKMEVKRDVSVDIRGRHVLILEDIYDTGSSLDFTYRHLLSRQPASLRICTLLDKPERRRPGITLKPDYVGFTIPNAFVVGYGLDFNEHYRNLPYVGVLKPEAYETVK